MTDNEKNEILASVRAALTGDAASDLVYLQEQAKKYEDSEDTKPVADALLDMAVEDMRSRGITPLYLVTDHTGFYEQYGWEYYCMVKEENGPGVSRMYIHR